MDITTVQFIPLQREGVFAIVDYDDRERFIHHKWHVNDKGYASRRRRAHEGPGSEKILMHHQVLSVPEGGHRDHANRNRLDNRRENLRPATQSQNFANGDLYASNRSGFKGVVWHKQNRRWRAQIRVNGRHRSLGCYASAVEAARAYDAAAIESFGEFASLNFPI